MAKIRIDNETSTPDTPTTGVRLYPKAGILYYRGQDGTEHEIATDNNLVFDNSITQAMLAPDSVGTSEIIAGNVDTAELANDAVTNDKLANIARGSIIVGGAANAPSYLDAKTAGRILVGDGTDLKSVAMSGDGTLAADGTLTLTNGLDGDAIGIVNLAPDPFFQYSYPGVDWGGRTRWQGITPANPMGMLVADADNPYGGNTIRHLATESSIAGVAIWLDEIGVGKDDILTIKLALKFASSTARLYAAFRTASDGVVGSTYNSGELTGGASPQVATVTATVPDGAAYVIIYTQRILTTDNIDWYALWLTRGSYSADFPTPAANLSPLLAQSYVQSGWDYNLHTVTVGTTGCDYTTIAAALAAIAPTMTNRYRLLLAAETFTEYELDLVDLEKEWIVFEGAGRDLTIVDGTLGANDLTKDTFNVAGQIMFKNMTIKAHNVKYCVHIDATDTYWTIHFDNVRLYHDTGFCLGMGLHAGQNVVAKNCIFEYGGTSATYRWGTFLHNWNTQLAGTLLHLENCRFDNCGIVTLQEMGSGQADIVRLINCKSNNLTEGVKLVVSTAYLGGDPEDIPYDMELEAFGSDCAYFSYVAVDRPLLDWHIPGWDMKVKNINGSTLAAGTAVAFSYVATGARTDIDLSQNRVDGVLRTDIASGAEGWMVTRGNCCDALVDNTVSQGAWLKPDATGVFTSATETTAFAVAMAARTGAGSVKVRLL